MLVNIIINPDIITGDDLSYIIRCPIHYPFNIKNIFQSQNQIIETDIFEKQNKLFANNHSIEIDMLPTTQYTFKPKYNNTLHLPLNITEPTKTVEITNLLKVILKILFKLLKFNYFNNLNFIKHFC